MNRAVSDASWYTARSAPAQVVALCYLAMVLRSRLVLEAENAALGRSVQTLNDEVNRDSLTGLYNRRYLDARVSEIRSLVSYGLETRRCLA